MTLFAPDNILVFVKICVMQITINNSYTKRSKVHASELILFLTDTTSSVEITYSIYGDDLITKFVD